MLIADNASQLLNALLPIVTTVEGIDNEVNPLHPKKASLPIEIRLSGNATDVRLTQPSNSAVPIDLIPLGIQTESKQPHLANA